jgi:hypothetical protein
MVFSWIHSKVRNWRFVGICLVLGILCFPSCVREIGNVETEYFYGDHRDDSVVLGRIGVVEDGVEKSWDITRIDPSTRISFQSPSEYSSGGSIPH